jgi:Tfp pilus assembly protein PilN
MKRINLLPKQKQKELAQERRLYSVSRAIGLSAIILLLGVAVQFGVWAYLSRQIKSSQAEIEQLKGIANKSENAAVKGQIIKVNGILSDFNKLSAKNPQWSAVLSAFVKNVPNGVKISQFDASVEKKEVLISGFSPSRDLVIDLYNNINSDKEHFANINYPLENVTKPTNVLFNFTFTVNDNLLVKEAVK